MDGELCKGKTGMEPREELTECEDLGEKRAECMWKIIQNSRDEFHAAAVAAKSLWLSPILCDHMDSSPPGSPIPGILQARTLEWVAISFSNA